jgi:hypothetical protein
MRPTLDNRRVSTAVRLTKDFDDKYHGRELQNPREFERSLDIEQCKASYSSKWAQQRPTFRSPERSKEIFKAKASLYRVRARLKTVLGLLFRQRETAVREHSNICALAPK